jgi:adenylosuccinate lyase
VNNTAVPLLWKESLENEYYPAIANLVIELRKLASSWKNISMLARTHGQPASPTNLGKEIMVYVERIEDQLNLLNNIPYSCKFGGATGNFNAHAVAFPEIDWIKFGNSFCSTKLGLQRQQFTTQIEHYDFLAAHFDGIKRINTILTDFARDVWTYISMDYFKQKTKAGEVGSSAMPHKVNPIDFENAEGNLGLANAIFEHLSIKLPVSRLQRDLTDSTVLRNIGVPFCHTFIALKSISKGIGKLVLNEEAIKADLDRNWAVVAEAIQTILRREHYPKPYEALKELTRGKSSITKESIHQFIDGLQVTATIKKELKKRREEGRPLNSAQLKKDDTPLYKAMINHFDSYESDAKWSYLNVRGINDDYLDCIKEALEIARPLVTEKTVFIYNAGIDPMDAYEIDQEVIKQREKLVSNFIGDSKAIFALAGGYSGQNTTRDDVAKTHLYNIYGWAWSQK